jgi:type III pantothenate kinase
MLLVDAGNTRIKWALTSPGEMPGAWQACGSVAHSEHHALEAAWASLSLSKVLVSNVAGEALGALLRAKLQQRGVRDSEVRWFRAQPECAGVKNDYAQPEQLGSVRFASLIGARHRFPGERLLVVTCGTATTIDALEADGHFIGGMIVPGLGTMAKSLAINTALLPAVEAAKRERVFADNTQEAIISGCLAAQVGAIAQAMAQRHDPAARCVISGGAAPYIVPHLPFPADAVDNLVLLGLHASVAGAS